MLQVSLGPESRPTPTQAAHPYFARCSTLTQRSSARRSSRRASSPHVESDARARYAACGSRASARWARRTRTPLLRAPAPPLARARPPSAPSSTRSAGGHTPFLASRAARSSSVRSWFPTLSVLSADAGVPRRAPGRPRPAFCACTRRVRLEARGRQTWSARSPRSALASAQHGRRRALVPVPASRSSPSSSPSRLAVHHCRLRGLRRYSPPGGPRRCQAPCLSLLSQVLLYHAMVADQGSSRLVCRSLGVLAGLPAAITRCSRGSSYFGTGVWEAWF